MITQYFMSFFANFIGFFVHFLPSADPIVLSNIASAITSVQSMLNSASWILPSNFYFCLTSAISLYVALFSWRFVKWVLHNVSLGLVKK